MVEFLSHICGGHKNNLRYKIISIYSLLIIFNIVVWLWAFFSLYKYPHLFSIAILAYTFGLRHAVDADHIAAIDNVTRKLMQEGKPQVATGLYFSLGHSTVVILASIGVVLAITTLMHSNLSQWNGIESIICTSVSVFFLLLIATINLIIFFSIYRVFKHVRRGGDYHEKNINMLLNSRGFLARIFGRLFQMISHSWQMYPLGLLFAIGFDTATEIALLGINASQTINGMSIWSILIYPALFTAGMTLIDTTDSVIMLGAYGWAFIKPIRKLYYNLTITFISIFVALFVGSIEFLGLLANKITADGFIWKIIRELNYHFNSLGFIIIAIFIASWLISVLVFKFMQFDKLENSK